MRTERGVNMWLQLNGEVRSDMEPPGSEEADASLSDLTVLGCVQGEAELSEVSNIGPSACPPWVPCYLAPPRVPRSLHSQIGGSRVHIQHLSVLDTSVCTGPLTAPSRILRGYSPTPGFPHFYSKLSPPQKESTVLPGSLDYTALRAGPRQLTLLCNHHYPHNCFSIGSQGRQRSSIIQ